MRFYEGVCAAVHAADASVPCVVGPAPFYKVWQLNGSMVLHDRRGAQMRNIIYTFNFYEPWGFVTGAAGGDAADGYAYPADYPCSVAYAGWVPLFCPQGGNQVVRVDRRWLDAMLARNPLALAAAAEVPVFCNQWGVKRSVSEAHGRLEYARDVATAFEEHGVHSTLWIWRSYRKSSWGFELVHEDESR